MVTEYCKYGENISTNYITANSTAGTCALHIAVTQGQRQTANEQTKNKRQTIERNWGGGGKRGKNRKVKKCEKYVIKMC